MTCLAVYDESPISVMARGLLERSLNPAKLDQWFEVSSPKAMVQAKNKADIDLDDF